MTTAATMAPPRLDGGSLLFGHGKDFMADPVEMLRQGYDEKGKIFSFRMGSRNAVVLTGPEYNKFFFSETDKQLSIREAYPFFHNMFSKDFYFFADMEEYLKQRAIIMPKFKASEMRNYVALMTEETMVCMHELGEEGEFDLTSTFGPLIMDIAAHAFLGRDFRRQLGHNFFDIFRDFSAGMDITIPASLMWLPWPHIRRSNKAKKELKGVIQSWLDNRRANPLDEPDFFQQLSEAKFKDGSTIPDDLIFQMIMLLVWAGHETTAGQGSWSLIDVLQNPEYKADIDKELDEVLGDASGVDMTWQQTLAMKKIDFALKETERLHPQPFVMMRQAAEDINLDGYEIRKGTMVLAAPCVSHRVEAQFPDANSYNPYRFDPEGNMPLPESNSLIGFGGGMHRCAGVNFARMEMKVILAMFLRHFDMELIDEPRPVKGPKTHWPDSPCRVRYKRRKRSAGVDAGAAAAAAAEAVGAEAAAAGCPMHES